MRTSLYFALSFPQNPQNFTKQWVNLQEPPTSKRCTHASKQQYLKQSKSKQTNCASGISPSSEMATPLTTALSSPSLHLVDCILVTFERQKNDNAAAGNLLVLHSPYGDVLADAHDVTSIILWQKNNRKANTVTQWQTTDKLLCPVKIWASIIWRVLSCTGANKNSPVSLVKHKNKIINVMVEMIANLCRNRVVTIDMTKLFIR